MQDSVCRITSMHKGWQCCCPTTSVANTPMKHISGHGIGCHPSNCGAMCRLLLEALGRWTLGEASKDIMGSDMQSMVH